MIVDGVNLSGLKERELAVFRRGKVGFVYQNFNLVPTCPVWTVAFNQLSKYTEKVVPSPTFDFTLI